MSRQESASKRLKIGYTLRECLDHVKKNSQTHPWLPRKNPFRNDWEWWTYDNMQDLTAIINSVDMPIARNSVISKLDQLYVMSYKLEKDDPIFSLISQEESQPLLICNSTAILLGWALVDPWPEHQVDRVTMFKMLLPNLDLTLDFTFFINLGDYPVLYEPFESDMPYWHKMGAVKETLENWGDRPLHRLGLGMPDRMLVQKQVDRAALAQLFEALEADLSAQRREFCMVYANLGLDCDVPILEALRHSWPAPWQRVAWLRRSDGGIRIVSPELMSGSMFHGRQLSSKEPLDGAVDIQMRFYLQQVTQFEMINPETHEILLGEGETYSIAFRGPKSVWAVLCKRWQVIFNRFGLVLKGGSFGDVLGSDL